MCGRWTEIWRLIGPEGGSVRKVVADRVGLRKAGELGLLCPIGNYMAKPKLFVTGEEPMKDFLKKIQDRLRVGASEQSTPEDFSNKEIIEIYNRMRGDWNLVPMNEPNYSLARKVFFDFNDFNLKNLSIHFMYLKFIPKSLLP
jgi:hypothetical protein